MVSFRSWSWRRYSHPKRPLSANYKQLQYRRSQYKSFSVFSFMTPYSQPSIWEQHVTLKRRYVSMSQSRKLPFWIIAVRRTSTYLFPNAGTLGSSVVWGDELQAERKRFRFPIKLLFIKLRSVSRCICDQNCKWVKNVTVITYMYMYAPSF
jgi:hypothetical protein